MVFHEAVAELAVAQNLLSLAQITRQPTRT
jgi:hypothetical protein